MPVTVVIDTEVLERRKFPASEDAAACRKAMTSKATFLRNVEKGRIDRKEAMDVASFSLDGYARCDKDGMFAVQLMDAALSEPMSLALGERDIQLFAKAAHRYKARLTSKRYFDAMTHYWLIGDGLAPTSGIGREGRKISEIVGREWLLNVTARAENLAYSEDRFRFWGHPERNDIVWELLTNPKHSTFDLRRAAKLVGHLSSEYNVDLARKLLDPSFGVPDPELAASVVSRSDPSHRRAIAERLLFSGAFPNSSGLAVELLHRNNRQDRYAIAWRLLSSETGRARPEIAAELVFDYSPFVDWGESDREAAEIWREIGRQYALSRNPSIAAYGKHIVATGSPNRPTARVLPDIPGLVVLDEWPEGLPKIDRARLIRNQNFAANYPMRAIREGVGGVVEIGLVFDKTGKYSEMRILRSSGKGNRGFDALDNWSTRGLERYVRPRISSMKLEGFEGRPVLVPIFELEWRIGKENKVEFVDDRLILTGKRRGPIHNY